MGGLWWVQDWQEVGSTSGSTNLARGWCLKRILYDSTGFWYFQTDSVHPIIYAVYRSGTVSVQPGKTDLGKIEYPFDPITFPWKIDYKREDVSLRHRLDGCSWSDFVALETFKLDELYEPGKHLLDIELFGEKALIRSPRLRYTFDVTYKINDIVADLVAKLGDREFKVWQKATDSLIDLGPRMIPNLRKLKTDDPEVRQRLSMILRALERQLKTTIHPSNSE